MGKVIFDGHSFHLHVEALGQLTCRACRAEILSDGALIHSGHQKFEPVTMLAGDTLDLKYTFHQWPGGNLYLPQPGDEIRLYPELTLRP